MTGLRKESLIYILVVLNVTEAPNKDDGMRYEQFQEMLRDVAEMMGSQRCWLFQARAPQIMVALVGMYEVEQDLWAA